MFPSASWPVTEACSGPQLIGFAGARRYLLTGEAITGTEAAAMGLITGTVDAADLDAVVDAWGERLLAEPEHALRWTRRR